MSVAKWLFNFIFCLFTRPNVKRINKKFLAADVYLPVGEAIITEVCAAASHLQLNELWLGKEFCVLIISHSDFTTADCGESFNGWKIITALLMTLTQAIKTFRSVICSFAD